MIYDKQWFADVRANLEKASGLKQTPPQNDPTAIHKAPEPVQDYAYLYGFGPISPSELNEQVRRLMGSAPETVTLTEAQLPSHSLAVSDRPRQPHESMWWDEELEIWRWPQWDNYLSAAG